MPQTIALDFGLKRTGIAVTDDLKLIASGLKTVESHKLMSFLKDYISVNDVDEIVLGEPKLSDGKPMAIEHNILLLISELKENFSTLKISRIDERFTSKIASFHISKSNLSQKKKRNKGLIDQVSATLILQDFLNKAL